MKTYSEIEKPFSTKFSPTYVHTLQTFEDFRRTLAMLIIQSRQLGYPAGEVLDRFTWQDGD